MSYSILRLKEVMQVTGLGRSVIYKKIKEGLFPQQIKLTERSSGWVESEINNWIEAKVQERNAGVK